MKRLRFVRAPFWAALCWAAVFLGEQAAQAAGSSWVDVQLVWATNEPQAPDSKYKSIDEATARGLRKSFKWKYYYEVNRQSVNVSTSGTKVHLKMSGHCTLDLQYLSDGHLEIQLFGDGKHVSTHRETMSTGWKTVLAGDDKNDTAWLVIIKKAEPPGAKAVAPASH
jgi:hypothetical protein